MITDSELLRDDDPDYLHIKEYKRAHGIARDLNDCDVVVLMRRVSQATAEACAKICDKRQSRSNVEVALECAQAIRAQIPQERRNEVAGQQIRSSDQGRSGDVGNAIPSAVPQPQESGRGEGGAERVQLCPGDNQPCLVGKDEDTHWRCGTCQCGQTELHGFGRSPQATLFEAIKHGDEAHQTWLKQAIEDHFAGRPVQRVVMKAEPQPHPTCDCLTREELVEALGKAFDGLHEMSGVSVRCVRKLADSLAGRGKNNAS